MMATPALVLNQLVRRTQTYASALIKNCLGLADHLQVKTILISVVLLSTTSCQKQENQNIIKEIKGDVFGSYYLVKYRGDLAEGEFRKELDVFFKNFNDEFSTYQKDSVISKFNGALKNKKLIVSKEFISMLELAKQFHDETEGAFNPTLAPVIKAWGFGGGRKKEADKDIMEAMKKVGLHHVKWDKEKFEVWKDLDGVELDVNAFAPGWAADLIGEMLLKKNVSNFMVDISGEILFKGTKGENIPWIGGIEKPVHAASKSVHLALKMNDVAMATSGNYRQFFDDNGVRKSHIIDPRTGAPVSHSISSATIIADTAAAADAWGTAMMVLGKEGIALAEKYGKKSLLLNAEKLDQFNEIVSPSMKSFIEKNKLD